MAQSSLVGMNSLRLKIKVNSYLVKDKRKFENLPKNFSFIVGQMLKLFWDQVYALYCES